MKVAVNIRLGHRAERRGAPVRDVARQAALYDAGSRVRVGCPDVTQTPDGPRQLLLSAPRWFDPDRLRRDQPRSRLCGFARGRRSQPLLLRTRRRATRCTATRVLVFAQRGASRAEMAARVFRRKRQSPFTRGHGGPYRAGWRRRHRRCAMRFRWHSGSARTQGRVGRLRSKDDLSRQASLRRDPSRRATLRRR